MAFLSLQVCLPSPAATTLEAMMPTVRITHYTLQARPCAKRGVAPFGAKLVVLTFPETGGETGEGGGAARFLGLGMNVCLFILLALRLFLP